MRPADLLRLARVPPWSCSCQISNLHLVRIVSHTTKKNTHTHTHTKTHIHTDTLTQTHKHTHTVNLRGSFGGRFTPSIIIFQLESCLRLPRRSSDGSTVPEKTLLPLRSASAQLARIFVPDDRDFSVRPHVGQAACSSVIKKLLVINIVFHYI